MMNMPVTPPAAIHRSRPVALEEAAARFADLGPVEAEATIDAFVAGAIAAWRLADATYWQRVKFHARLIRTMRRNEAAMAAAAAKSLPVPGQEARE